jgi:hypothetical protein
MILLPKDGRSEWYKACQTAVTDEGLITDTGGINGRGEMNYIMKMTLG